MPFQAIVTSAGSAARRSPRRSPRSRASRPPARPTLGDAGGLERDVHAVAVRELANRRDGVDGRRADDVRGPKRSAHASFGAATSTAISRPAPAILAPCNADRPILPSPTTATRAPGYTFVVWIAAPTPVDAPQPRRQALAAGARAASGSPRTRARRCGLASVPSDSVPASGAASRARRTRGGCVHACEHRRGTPRRQGPQVPHSTAQASTTGSPTAGDRTPSPTDSTTRALVAEEHRERRAPVPVLDRPQVRMAHTARHEANEDLARTERADRKLLDADGAARFVHDGADRLARHVPPFPRERLMLASASRWTRTRFAIAPRPGSTSSSRPSRRWSTSTVARTRRPA